MQIQGVEEQEEEGGEAPGNPGNTAQPGPKPPAESVRIVRHRSAPPLLRECDQRSADRPFQLRETDQVVGPCPVRRRLRLEQDVLGVEQVERVERAGDVARLGRLQRLLRLHDEQVLQQPQPPPGQRQPLGQVAHLTLDRELGAAPLIDRMGAQLERLLHRRRPAAPAQRQRDAAAYAEHVVAVAGRSQQAGGLVVARGHQRVRDADVEVGLVGHPGQALQRLGPGESGLRRAQLRPRRSGYSREIAGHELSFLDRHRQGTSRHRRGGRPVPQRIEPRAQGGFSEVQVDERPLGARDLRLQLEHGLGRSDAGRVPGLGDFLVLDQMLEEGLGRRPRTVEERQLVVEPPDFRDEPQPLRLDAVLQGGGRVNRRFFPQVELGQPRQRLAVAEHQPLRPDPRFRRGEKGGRLGRRIRQGGDLRRFLRGGPRAGKPGPQARIPRQRLKGERPQRFVSDSLGDPVGRRPSRCRADRVRLACLGRRCSRPGDRRQNGREQARRMSNHLIPPQKRASCGRPLPGRPLRLASAEDQSNRAENSL